VLASSIKIISVKKLTDEQLVALFIEIQKNLYFEQLYSHYACKVSHKCLPFAKNDTKAIPKFLNKKSAITTIILQKTVGLVILPYF
jgi:hypothetical protein